jgi:selenide, water dikinase
MQSQNGQTVPLTRDIVLIGGGHTHALVLRSFAMKPILGARLTLINPGPTAPYSGMLPGHIAGHYARQTLDMDLVRLARAAGARLVLDHAVGIDRSERRIVLGTRPAVSYDLASIDIGITSDLPDLQGFETFAVPAKPLGPMAERWEAHVALENPGPVVILGGGVAGLELAMACAHRLNGRTQVTVVDRGSFVQELSRKTRKILLDALAKNAVKLRPNCQITEIAQDHVVLGDGTTIPANLVIGAAGAKAQLWLGDTGLELENGFVRVDASLRSSDPDIFAAGDCAHMVAHPRPKAGVFAVRQAPVLADNLRAALTKAPFKTYKPQKDYLKLISLGGKKAVADKSGFRVVGSVLWKLKDKIDRDFMAKFEDLPNMRKPLVPPGTIHASIEALSAAPLCGGCGAKVGSDDLDAALAVLPPPRRDDVLSVAGDDAALLKIENGVQVISTDHLRAVTDDPWMMARIALVHALGDVWAMGAKPQAVLSSVILPQMSPRMQRETLREITSAVAEILSLIGADLVGGHTTQGSELTLGFTVTGTTANPITLAGAAPRDVLVLTRPLGTGVLLAAEMQRRADGRDIAALLEAMAQPQMDAANALAPMAKAMTDVTGFSLMGHLKRMCEASGTGAEISLDAIPIYKGALDAAEAGVRSSLYPANRAPFGDISTENPKAELLFDPQTCGGLLAAVSKSKLDELTKTYPGAVLIGRVTDTPGIKVN